MRTANPALSEQYFETEARAAPRAGVMTIGGAVQKTALLTVLLLGAGAVSWTMVHPQTGSHGYDPTYRMLFGLGAPILAFVVALVTCFVPKISPVTAPLYAVLEGLFLGAFSAFVSAKYQGLVVQAGLLTSFTLAIMLFAYGTRMIRVTQKLRLGIVAATGAVFLAYLVGFVLSLFGVNLGIFEAGPIGIVFSAIVVGVAALNLVLDFDMIETGARVGAPKYMEWFAGFGLLVTLVWLYIEIVRLLIKIRNNQ